LDNDQKISNNETKPTIIKINLKLMPYLYNRKKWTGWELKPRPQL